LETLLALVELQAAQGHGLGEGGLDIPRWVGVVLFEGWEHWWDAAEAAVPQTSRAYCACWSRSKYWRIGVNRPDRCATNWRCAT
jgi:hypothetical protein